MKFKAFFLTVVFFSICLLKLFAATNDSVYAIFSDHYTDICDTKIIIVGDYAPYWVTPYTTDTPEKAALAQKMKNILDSYKDGGYSRFMKWAGYSTLDEAAKLAPSELLASKKPIGVCMSQASMDFTYGDFEEYHYFHAKGYFSGEYIDFVNSRKKNLKDYKLVMLNLKFGNKKDGLNFGYVVQDGTTTARLSITLEDFIPGYTTAAMDLKFIEKQMDPSKAINGWYNVVFSTSQFLNAYKRIHSAQANNAKLDSVLGFVVSVSTTGYTTFYFDNFVLFNEMPTQIKISTSGLTLPGNTPIFLSAEAYDGFDNLSAINPPTWNASGGSLANTRGYLNSFQSNAIGSHNITVTATVPKDPDNLDYSDKTLTAVSSISISHLIDWKSRFNVFSNYIKYGTLGIFKDSADIRISTSSENSAGITGNRSLKVNYEVYSSTGWAGFAISEPELKPRNLSFTNSPPSILSFKIKFGAGYPARDLTVGIRSKYVSVNDNKAKIKLSELGYRLDWDWQEVRILLYNFKVKEPNLNFSEIIDTFILADEGGTAVSTEFYIDDIKWLSAVEEPITFDTNIKNVSNNMGAQSLSWNIPSLPFNWQASDQYIETKIINYDMAKWGIQIYTDNKGTSAVPVYTGVANPVGLVGVRDSSRSLGTCWMLTDARKTRADLPIVEIKSGNDINLSTSTSSNYYIWQWMKDKNTQDDPTRNITRFVDKESAVNIITSEKGAHYAIGEAGFAINMIEPPSTTVVRQDFDTYYLYLGANFDNAKSSEAYTTNTLTLEYYVE